MSEDVIEKLFVPFFTTKDVGEGTGLGLPVAHGIVTSHGGSIKVESALGRGTRFEIELPLAGPKTAGENT
jgi:signal transduction histidine kinase